MASRLKRLTTERSATIILFLLVFAMAARISVDADLWWHLRSGQYIAETGQLIYPDPFSHTFSDIVHWNHSAISDVLLYAIWRHSGFAGITVAAAIAATVGMSFLFATCRGSAYPRAFLIVLGAATAAVFWSPRPQMLSFVLASVLLWILRDLKYKGRDRLLWIAPLQLIWCNAHGGFIIGYLLVGVFVLGEVLNSKFGTSDSCLPLHAIRKLLLVSVASMPLLILNPLGIQVYSVPFSTISMPELSRYIQEWQSPDFSQSRAWGFVLLLALVLATMCWSKRKLDCTEWFLVCGSAAMGLLAARNLALFAIAAAPVASDHLDDILQDRGWVIPFRDREPVVRALVNLCLIISVSIGLAAHLCHLLSAETIGAGLRSALPVDAVEQLDSLELHGNMFNSYNWGGYLMFHAPEHPVFIDGRSDLYRSFLDEYYWIATARDGWQQALDRWRVGFAVIESNSGLAEALTSHPDWQTAYQDPLASIFLRRTPLTDG
ncbi:MAG: hypothetical protein OXG39_10865 [Chloroflexi bacterium]|nr:hypothetical protein [Chloroflexota bacterium]